MGPQAGVLVEGMTFTYEDLSPEVRLHTGHGA